MSNKTKNSFKALLIIFALTLLLAGCSKNKPIEETIKTIEELEKMDYDINEYVDDILNEATDDKFYKDLTLRQRELSIERILGELKNKELILHYQYNKDNLFSFQYKDGVLGGVLIKQFETYPT